MDKTNFLGLQQSCWIGVKPSNVARFMQRITKQVEQIDTKKTLQIYMKYQFVIEYACGHKLYVAKKFGKSGLFFKWRYRVHH